MFRVSIRFVNDVLANAGERVLLFGEEAVDDNESSS